jgi:hypothetical protein
MSDTKTNTQVTQVSEDELDNLLGMPGGEVANMTPEAVIPEVDQEKPKFFQNGKVDTSFLNEPDATEPMADPVPADSVPDPVAIADPEPVDTTSFDSIVEDLTPDSDDPKAGGRPSLDKKGMAQLAQALIDDKVILPFEEDKKLEDYTMDDYKELFSMNFQEKEKTIKENTPKEFFKSLPNELKAAAKYVADGGNDMKGLFKALAASEEVKSLDPSTERGQETIVRQYLQANDFGNDEEIQEEIDSWKDLEKLEAKANQFKPKLDKMQDAVVQRRLEEQEYKKQQQQDASYKYADSIFSTLEKGNLNGLKLDNKTQNMLYNGLVQPNYPSVNGSNTNLFGHLIEKHQFVEPNHGLIAEALWLLADPDGYKSQISKGATNVAAADVARQLKSEQANKNGGGAEPQAGNERTTGAHQRTIKRPGKGFFGRE